MSAVADGAATPPPLHSCGQKQRWCRCGEPVCDAPGHAPHVCTAPARCSAVSPQGVQCRLDAGHEGSHLARAEASALATKPEHHCHARGCRAAVKPELLMCARHWRMVPRDLQRQVWATYRPGQCDDKNPSRAWHAAADAAIAAVAKKEASRG